jgi:hypothetical protein
LISALLASIRRNRRDSFVAILTLQKQTPELNYGQERADQRIKQKKALMPQ